MATCTDFLFCRGDSPTDGDGAGLKVGQWPIGAYGGAPTEPSGYNRDFLACGEELNRLGRLETDIRKQLFGIKLTHRDGPKQLAQTALQA